MNSRYNRKMNFPKIAFKIEDRVYRLDASNGPAIKKLPKQDREHLITLLGAIKKQHDILENNYQENPAASAHASEKQVLKAQQEKAPVNIKEAQSASHLENNNTENIEANSKGDIDQMMARLIAQERRQSSSIDKQKAYLWMGGITLGILFILLMLV